MQPMEPYPANYEAAKNEEFVTSNPDGVTAAGPSAEASHLESIVEQANEKVKNFKPDEEA
jgi:hypothetical protein